MDLGFESAGIHSRWLCERDRRARSLLRMKWPELPIYNDIRHMIGAEIEPVDLIHGGDPCPRHSRARQVESDSPDLSGYFLALVGQCRPRWVVRENVLAPTVDHFAVALEHLGYGVAVIGLDGGEITGQSRPREFVVGHREATGESVRRLFPEARDGCIPYQQNTLARQVSGCLDTRAADRLSWGQNYIFENGRLRVYDSDEREQLAGLPVGWTEGFSRAARSHFTGNTVIPAMAAYIGNGIAGETDVVD